MTEQGERFDGATHTLWRMLNGWGDRYDNFLADLLAVYRKYDLSLGHEDHQGAFIIEDFSVENVSWVLDARRPPRSPVPPPIPPPPPPPPA